MSLKPEQVADAYRFLLGREPEAGLDLKQAAAHFKNWRPLRESVLSSNEGRNRLYEGVMRKNTAWVRMPTYFGRFIYVCFSDLAVSKNLILTGRWEPEVEEGILSLLNPNGVFLDVGANIGWFSLLVADRIVRSEGNGHVISVEANPSILPYFMSSVVESGLDSRISIKPYAVSSGAGIVQMESALEGNIGGLNISSVAAEGGGRNVVPTVALDDLLVDLERLDLVKMDIEGAEPMAISGFSKTLKRFKPSIIMEINKDGLANVSGKTVTDLFKQMKDLGYNCYDFRAGRLAAKLSSVDVNRMVTQHSYYDFLFR